MSKCRNCNVEISDETERCPLCGSVLEYTGEVENMYPDVRVHTRKMTMISKIYLFCALLVEVLLIYINVVTESQIAWSAITGLGFFYGYMLIRFAILGKTGYRAKITVLTLMAILIGDRNRFSGRLPRMVCQLCIAVGDHFSRCWYYHLYDRKPQKLAELYDVADFYDLMQHCSGNTDFYRYRDGTAFCTDRICVFPVSVSWNTDHRRPQGKGGTETKISCPLSYI